ncbi:hypothetical protein LZ32DRAFT_90750 [Colletotrichum eremochloae]|nr:hypothetical protein LZ32DRAFT_90750 [Colletotrichum eremochloae]
MALGDQPTRGDRRTLGACLALKSDLPVFLPATSTVALGPMQMPFCSSRGPTETFAPSGKFSAESTIFERTRDGTLAVPLRTTRLDPVPSSLRAHGRQSLRVVTLLPWFLTYDAAGLGDLRKGLERPIWMLPGYSSWWLERLPYSVFDIVGFMGLVLT